MKKSMYITKVAWDHIYTFKEELRGLKTSVKLTYPFKYKIVAFEISVLLPFVCVCTRALVRVNKNHLWVEYWRAVFEKDRYII